LSAGYNWNEDSLGHAGDEVDKEVSTLFIFCRVTIGLMKVMQKMRQRSKDERTDFGLEVRWSVLSGNGAEILSSNGVKQSQNFGDQIGFQKTSSASIFQNDIQNLEEVAGDEPAEGVDRGAVAVVPIRRRPVRFVLEMCPGLRRQPFPPRGRCRSG
jgi:hypothetical protein